MHWKDTDMQNCQMNDNVFHALSFKGHMLLAEGLLLQYQGKKKDQIEKCFKAVITIILVSIFL